MKWLRIFCLASLLLLVVVMSVMLPAQAAPAATLTLVTAVEVGGRPDTLVVDHNRGRNDIIFWDSFTNHLRFLNADMLQLAPQEVSIPTWSTDRVLVYDQAHSRAYAVSTRGRGVQPNTWYEARVHMIGWRQELDQFSINGNFNDPHPVDDHYYIDGFVYKQPLAEGYAPGRLILDNTPQGFIDVVDFKHNATGIDRVQRFNYRSPVPTTGWHTNEGNSLALETRHQTLSNDDLMATDLLYISDQSHQSELHVVKMAHPGLPLGATAEPPVDLTPFNCGLGGCKGVAVVDATDRLYVASGNQSFATGYLNEVDTRFSNPLQRWIELTYGDHYFLHADWHDPSRLFVATHDWYQTYDPLNGLYLHMLDGGSVVGSLLLQQNYDDGLDTRLRDMVFDPYSRRLYVSLGSQILVVAVDYGSDPPPLPPAPLPVATIVIDSPFYGGTLNVPDDSATLSFPPNWVSETTTVTYTQRVRQPAGALLGVRFFEITAVPVSSGTPLTTTNTYALDLFYDNQERAGAVESSLALYWWDGSGWVPEPTGSLNVVDDELTAVPDRVGRFAILGETKRVFLPVLVNESR